FDKHYVENWSLLQDILIILKTIPAVCALRGSY
ncbi:exopolysaccharide biosynthesis protein, partial [Phyllobacterium endophyticum]